MKVGNIHSLDEFTISQTAARKNLKNEPPPEVVENIQALCKFVIDPFEEHNKVRIVVSSGYRSPAVNKAVGGSPTSQHVRGEAVDFIVPGWTVKHVCLKMKQMGLPFDQLIDEFGQWIHVSYTRSGLANRQEFMKARKVKGKTVYSRG